MGGGEMKSKQVLSIEQMQHLQELGLDTSNASAFWCNPDRHGDWSLEFTYSCGGIIPQPNRHDDFCPAYTLHDVLDKLPKEINSRTRRFWLRIDLEDECLYYYYDNLSLVEIRKKVFGYNGMGELIDAAYEMLCWCIKNKHIKTNKKTV